MLLLLILPYTTIYYILLYTTIYYHYHYIADTGLQLNICDLDYILLTSAYCY